MKNLYTYKITFETGHYYFGSRSCKCQPSDDTTYSGSPVTNKYYWKDHQFTKEIIKICSDIKELMLEEHKLIGDLYKTDDLCLNDHNSLGFCSTGKKWWNKDGKIKLSDGSPGEGWVLGRPDITLRQLGKKKPNTSKSLKGKLKSISHKKSLSDSKQKQLYLYLGENNVMKRPDVKKKHQEKMNTPEYRKKVSDGVLNSDRWNKEKREEHSNRVSLWIERNGNPTSKKVTLGDIEYPSISQAMVVTGLSRYMVKKKMKINKIVLAFHQD